MKSVKNEVASVLLREHASNENPATNLKISFYVYQHTAGQFNLEVIYSLTEHMDEIC